MANLGTRGRRLGAIALLAMLGAAAGATGCASVPAGDAEPPPLLWGGLRRGPHAVGLRVVSLADRTRPDPRPEHAAGRPLEIVVWYPAGDGGRRVTLADYVRLSRDVPAERDAAPERGVLRRWLSSSVTTDSAGLPDSLADALLDAPLAARLGAPPRRARHPLVLWSARHATPAAQSVLSELLASHGYVVAVARYDGPPMPLPFQAASPAEREATLEAHVGDLRAALSHLRGLPEVDASRVGVLAWSYGGESATVLQQRAPEVRAVVSLSSNPFTWVYQPRERVERLTPASLRVPYALLTERVGTNGDVRTPPPLLERSPAGGYFVVYPELAHGTFNVLEGMIPGLTGVANVPRWSKAGPVGRAGYETVARHTLALLDALVKTPGADPAAALAAASAAPGSVRYSLTRLGGR